MFHWLVGDRELPQVAAHHLCLQGEGQLTSHTHKATPTQSPYLNLHLVEGLSLVDAHNAPNHLWDNDHVAQVGLHTGGLLHGRGLLLGLAQSLDQCQWLSLQACTHVEISQTSQAGIGQTWWSRYTYSTVIHSLTHLWRTCGARGRRRGPSAAHRTCRAAGPGPRRGT